MNENLNLVELLKNCPKGMELDCTILDSKAKVFLETVLDDDSSYPIVVIVEYNNTKYTETFTKYGAINNMPYCKCNIFPKGKTTWEGFQRPFKDGDIITCTNSVCSFVAIFKEINTDITFKRYVSLTLDDKQQFCTKERWADFKNPRFATKDEEQKLFNAIKKNGYKWNTEKKVLEKLSDPEFKDGDIIHINVKESNFLSIYKGRSNREIYIYLDLHLDDNYLNFSIEYNESIPFEDSCDLTYRLATEEEKEHLFNVIREKGYKWNTEKKILEKLSDLKFKVGDRLQWKGSSNSDITTVTKLKEDRYILNNGNYIKFGEEDLFNVLGFDPKTLKPFDKVLGRFNNYGTWISHISDDDNYPYFCSTGLIRYCIPYNDDTAHLVGTDKEAPEYYRYGED